MTTTAPLDLRQLVHGELSLVDADSGLDAVDRLVAPGEANALLPPVLTVWESFSSMDLDDSAGGRDDDAG